MSACPETLQLQKCCISVCPETLQLQKCNLTLFTSTQICRVICSTYLKVKSKAGVYKIISPILEKSKN